MPSLSWLISINKSMWQELSNTNKFSFLLRITTITTILLP
jgi:hypothetical protein